MCPQWVGRLGLETCASDLAVVKSEAVPCRHAIFLEADVFAYVDTITWWWHVDSPCSLDQAVAHQSSNCSSRLHLLGENRHVGCASKGVQHMRRVRSSGLSMENFYGASPFQICPGQAVVCKHYMAYRFRPEQRREVGLEDVGSRLPEDISAHDFSLRISIRVVSCGHDPLDAKSRSLPYPLGGGPVTIASDGHDSVTCLGSGPWEEVSDDLGHLLRLRLDDVVHDQP